MLVRGEALTRLGAKTAWMYSEFEESSYCAMEMEHAAVGNAFDDGLCKFKSARTYLDAFHRWGTND